MYIIQEKSDGRPIHITTGSDDDLTEDEDEEEEDKLTDNMDDSTLDMLGESFEESEDDNAESVSSAANVMPMLTQLPVEPPSDHVSSFILVGDNLDKSIRPR